MSNSVLSNQGDTIILFFANLKKGFAILESYKENFKTNLIIMQRYKNNKMTMCKKYIMKNIDYFYPNNVKYYGVEKGKETIIFEKSLLYIN